MELGNYKTRERGGEFLVPGIFPIASFCGWVGGCLRGFTHSLLTVEVDRWWGKRHKKLNWAPLCQTDFHRGQGHGVSHGHSFVCNSGQGHHLGDDPVQRQLGHTWQASA